jgi:hypothetical protein
MHMRDVFPTLLTLLEIPVPSDRRGQVIPAFTDTTPLQPDAA